MYCVNCGIEASENDLDYCPGCGDGPLCKDCLALHVCDNEEYELFV